MHVGLILKLFHSSRIFYFFIHPSPTLYFGWGSFQGVVFKVADSLFLSCPVFWRALGVLDEKVSTELWLRLWLFLSRPVFWGALEGLEPSEWTCFPWLVSNSLLGFPSLLFPCSSETDGELLFWHQLQLFSILIVTQPVAYLKWDLLPALSLWVCFSHASFSLVIVLLSCAQQDLLGNQNWGEQARALQVCRQCGPWALKVTGTQEGWKGLAIFAYKMGRQRCIRRVYGRKVMSPNPYVFFSNCIPW